MLPPGASLTSRVDRPLAGSLYSTLSSTPGNGLGCQGLAAASTKWLWPEASFCSSGRSVSVAVMASSPGARPRPGLLATVWHTVRPHGPVLEGAFKTCAGRLGLPPGCVAAAG